MGGFGSGQRERHKVAKRTVEESLVLDVRQLRHLFGQATSGTVTWRGEREGGGGNALQGTDQPQNQPSTRTIAEIEFSISVGDPPTLTLQYFHNDEEIEIPICLETTPTQFGGRRWWFTCPWCTQRVGKLYLPLPEERHFRCRKCHNLTYRSSQEAHQLDRVAAQLGLDFRFDAESRRIWRKRFGHR